MWKQLTTRKTNANVITCITRSKVTKLYKLGTNARAFYTKRKFSRRNVCTVESIHSTAIWVRINTGILSTCKVYPCTKDLFLWHPPDTCTWYNDIQSVSFCKAPNNTTLKARGWNVGSDCKNIEGLCAAHMLEGYSGINLNSIKMVCTRSWRYEKAHSPYTRYIMNG